MQTQPHFTPDGKAIPAHIDPDIAFQRAIESGRLSDDVTNPLYAGNFMYMGTNSAGTALFKNIITRAYLA